MEINCVPEGVWPKGQVHGSWPLLLHTKELLPHALGEVADGLFCNAVLEVGINPAKGELLSLGAATVLESVVCKLSIVAVVVEDADAMLPGKVLNCALCFVVSSEVSLVMTWM